MKKTKKSMALKKNGSKAKKRAAKPKLPQRVADAMHKKKKAWTIMVYLGGDNNLAEEMVYALKSMYSIGSTSRHKIFAYFDTGLRPTTFPIPTREERREKLGNGSYGLALAIGGGVGAAYAKPVTVADGCQVTEDHKLLREAEELDREREKAISR